MKKYLPYFLVFVFGVFTAYLFLKPKPSEVSNEEGKLMSYEIKKLNKMVVIEEYYTYQQSFQENTLPKSWIDEYSLLKYIDHQNVVLLAKGTSQVSYDMKKAVIEVDEPNKTIVIKSLPKPEFQLFTDIDYLDLDTGLINEIDAEDLNKYKNLVNKKIAEQVDKPDLEKKAHQQLVENLSDLFVLAKALNWKIEDQTNIRPQVEIYLKNLQ